MTEPARFQRSGATWRPAHRELHWDVHPTFFDEKFVQRKTVGRPAVISDSFIGADAVKLSSQKLPLL